MQAYQNGFELVGLSSALYNKAGNGIVSLSLLCVFVEKSGKRVRIFSISWNT